MPTAADKPATTAPEPDDAQATADEMSGPSSHETCGQFPADEVAGK